MRNTTRTEVEQVLIEVLLHKSCEFSKLCYYLMIVNGCIAAITCGLLIVGKIQEITIPAMTGFGTLALVHRAGKESRHSLELLINYLGQRK